MTLEQYLRDEVVKAGLKLLDDDWSMVKYAEDTNPDALTDAWLDKQTSYIWKVGVLTITDANKMDWSHVFIGHERAPGKLEFIGRLFFSDGENDDPGRCLTRYLKCAEAAEPFLFNSSEYLPG